MLLRLTADLRLAAAPWSALGMLAAGAGSLVFLPPLEAGLFTLALTGLQQLSTALARHVRAVPDLGRAQRRAQVFTALDTLSALAASGLVARLLLSGGGVAGTQGADVYGLAAALAYLTGAARLGAGARISAIIAALPAFVAAALMATLRPGLEGLAVGGLLALAGLAAPALSRHANRFMLGALEARAATDGLIAELEAAKASSDAAARQAEAASVAKSRFLAQMSHELRTPLNAILGFSEVMKSELLGRHAVPTYKEYAGDIHASGKHLLNLIDEILDISRIESGRYELNDEPVALADMVEDCRELLKIRARTRGIRIHELYEPKLPKLRADERALRRICLNLISNAVKFAPLRGEVWVKVGWTASGGQYLSVRDSGPGISPEQRAVLLATFGRAEAATRNADEGAGLGLAIVKGLAELHGGALHLRGRPEEGTEFIVTFPALRVLAEPDADGADAPETEPAEPAQAGSESALGHAAGPTPSRAAVR
ncbi:HAMP domain-containing histidine kinase [Ancylobacter sp. 6x-1]|uniref:histidine kinase n=1 Tax=Ancylobacter crimeensis TaxID=2579147 RepID=A0ABT0D8A3_9HYPH|nr:HAMP domain-containing sensor histidine kinase [Ancylobacter crimeensis]MCK0196188.1 HAMP domain-containing histidine kinase [Ancylobacter crimeensis]